MIACVASKDVIIPVSTKLQNAKQLNPEDTEIRAPADVHERDEAQDLHTDDDSSDQVLQRLALAHNIVHSQRTCRAPAVLPDSTSIPKTLMLVSTLDDSFSGMMTSQYRMTRDMTMHATVNTLLTHLEQYRRHRQTAQRKQIHRDERG